MLGQLSDRFLLKVQMCFFAKGFCNVRKVSRTWGFGSISKSDGSVGHLKRIWKDELRVAGAVQETCSSEMLGGQGANFLRRVAFWSIRSSGLLMIVRDRCSTSSDLASLLPGRCSTLHRWSRKKRKTHWYVAVSSALNFPWRKSRRIASFLMLSTSKIEDVSQTCFVFDVDKFKNWGCLAELLRFWCCQKLRKSRRIASFSSLQIAGRQIDGQLQLQVPLRYTTTTTTNASKLRYTALHYTKLITSNYTTQVKISMFQTMSSKTPVGRSTRRLPEIFPPTKLNATKKVNTLSFQTGCNYTTTTATTTTTTATTTISTTPQYATLPLHCTNYIAVRYKDRCNSNYITLHYTTLIILHYATTTTATAILTTTKLRCAALH